MRRRRGRPTQLGLFACVQLFDPEHSSISVAQSDPVHPALQVHIPDTASQPELCCLSQLHLVAHSSPEVNCWQAGGRVGWKKKLVEDSDERERKRELDEDIDEKEKARERERAGVRDREREREERE